MGGQLALQGLRLGADHHPAARGRAEEGGGQEVGEALAHAGARPRAGRRRRRRACRRPARPGPPARVGGGSRAGVAPAPGQHRRPRRPSRSGLPSSALQSSASQGRVVRRAPRSAARGSSATSGGGAASGVARELVEQRERRPADRLEEPPLFGGEPGRAAGEAAQQRGGREGIGQGAVAACRRSRARRRAGGRAWRSCSGSRRSAASRVSNQGPSSGADAGRARPPRRGTRGRRRRCGRRGWPPSANAARSRCDLGRSAARPPGRASAMPVMRAICERDGHVGAHERLEPVDLVQALRRGAPRRASITRSRDGSRPVLSVSRTTKARRSRGMPRG